MELIYRTADRRNGNLIKRTKSFWKFGKSDDEILEGMAMWRHRDLVQTDHEKNDERNREATLKRLRKKSLENVNSISTNSSETLKNGQNGSKHDLTLMLDDTGVKYPMTKSDIDLRVQQQQQQKHEEQIYGVIEVPVQRSSQNVVSRSKLLRQSYLEMEQDEPNIANTNTLDNSNSNGKAKRAQTAHPQPQVRTSKSGYSKVNNDVKSSSAAKIAQNQDIIEFYDTRHLNTLQKRKHAYDDADLEDSSLIITTPSSGRHLAADAAFFDDESVNGEIIMKTVNRQEILKQYYSSGTDTERHSASSSDPYDCIVVEDHLVRKENEKNKANNAKLEFSTFRGDEKDSETEQKSRTATLLPRTKLTKTSSKDSGGGGGGGAGHQQPNKRDDFSQANGDKRDRRNGGGGGERNRNGDAHGRQEHDRNKSNGNGNRYGGGGNDHQRSSSMQHIDAASNKSYGQWYDLWGRDASVNMS